MSAVRQIEQDDYAEARAYALEQMATAACLEVEAQCAEPMKARTGMGPSPQSTNEGE